MCYYRERTSAFFTQLAYGLCRKLRPAVYRSPAPQTSLIFELPDELILSILSHISPDPRPASQHIWFCSSQYNLKEGDDCRQQRVGFLRPLSMTCRAMRLRFLPWIWEYLELPPPCTWGPGEKFLKRLNVITYILRANTFLATSVRVVKMDVGCDSSTLLPFIKCLESLPNLHTLEMGWMDDSITAPLGKALKGVELPQIKALNIFPTAHPILQHCRNVEDVACVVKYQIVPPDGFLRSLTSNRDSKVKRLTIPLVLWDDAPQFVAACSRLTELTVISPYPSGAQRAETGILLDPAGRARSALLELVVACKALPDFDTLQIARFPIILPRLACWCGQEQCGHPRLCPAQWERALAKQTKDLEEWAADCLKEPETGYLEEEERKKTTLRVIKIGPGCRSVMVEECEVYGFDNRDL